MSTPTYEIGQRVVYWPERGPVEQGVVTGVNAPGGLVFVQYDGDQGSKATPAEMLEPEARWLGPR